MRAKGDPEAADGLRRLVLTGFMGSGKTSVGRLLATRLGWHFADLDECIEAQLGLSVPRIFAEHGEPAFRAAEGNALRTLLARSRLVVALGGGAPETPEVRDLLAAAPETAVIYLEAEFDPLYKRCALQSQDPQAVKRPLLGSAGEALTRFDRRRNLYQAIATATVAAHPGTPAQVAAAILAMLKPRLLQL